MLEGLYELQATTASLSMLEDLQNGDDDGGGNEEKLGEYWLVSRWRTGIGRTDADLLSRDSGPSLSQSEHLDYPSGLD